MRSVLLALALAGCHPPDITTGDTRVVSATAIDGDTFRIEDRRYRLARIDAPELPGHCRPGRHCVAGDPYAAKRALQWYIDQGLYCRAIGIDVYHRTLVECTTAQGHLNVNDALVATGQAQPYRR